MPDAQSRWFYIVRQLQVAGKLSTKVARNHLLLSVTGGSERCRSGSEISGARLYQRQGAERWSGGLEGCRIRDVLVHCMRQFPPIKFAIPTRVAKFLHHIPDLLHIRMVPHDFELCLDLGELGEVVQREPLWPQTHPFHCPRL
jgi:hypothetical protein